MEGLSVNWSRGKSTLAGVVRRSPSAGRTVLPGGAGSRVIATAIVTLALLAGAASAQASEASQIVEKCAHGQPIGGYSQRAYRQALKQLPTIAIEYSECANEIRKAELSAAGGGAGTTSSSIAPNVPLALTPTEQHAVQSAHHNGATPVQIGSEPIRPGVVHADIASAVNTLPSSLLAVLAFMVGGALVFAIAQRAKRVRARRDG